MDPAVPMASRLSGKNSVPSRTRTRDDCLSNHSRKLYPLEQSFKREQSLLKYFDPLVFAIVQLAEVDLITGF